MKWLGGRPAESPGALLRGAIGALIWAVPVLAQNTSVQGLAPLPAALASAVAPLVLRGVTVIDVRTGRHLPDRTVVIAGTRIRVLGRTGQVRVPRAAYVVDARGKYLIPGLWDMHVHPWFSYGSDITYLLLLANGVTGMRDAGSTVPLATFRQWKREIAAGTRLGPRLFVAGPSLDEAEQSDYPQHINVTTREVAQQRVDTAAARRVVDSLWAAGADFIKPYTMSEEMYFVIAAEARRLGMPFGGHQPEGTVVRDGRRILAGGQAPGVTGRIVDSGARFIDHWLADSPWRLCDDSTHTRLTAQQCAAVVARRFRRGDTWLVTSSWINFPRVKYEQVQRFYPTAPFGERDTLSLDTQPTDRDHIGAHLRVSPEFARPAPTSIADWIALVRAQAGAATDSERRKQREPDLAAAGLPILLGTDEPLGGVPGFVVHSALAGFVAEREMTSLSALQTATLNPALALHAIDSLGTVEAGKLADLVLLDADPLADITNTTKIRAVIANGRYYDRAALDGLLATAERLARR